jgi:hypothetical protein
MDAPFDRIESILRPRRVDYKAETRPSLSSIEAGPVPGFDPDLPIRAFVVSI